MSPPDDIRDKSATQLSEGLAPDGVRARSVGPESEMRGDVQESVERPAATPTAIGSQIKSATEARQGVTLGTMRWVLGISLTLAIVAIALAFRFG